MNCSDTNIYFVIFIMAFVTYILRMAGPVILRKPFRSRFLKSFLYYAPYITLTALTVPAIFESSADTFSVSIGFVVACLTAFFSKSLPLTALLSCLSVYVVSLF